MSKLERIAIAVLLSWALTATILAASFGIEVQVLRKKLEKRLIHVTVAINYGNGTIEWHNNTPAFLGFTVYDVLILVADVRATQGAYGVYVYAINGVYSTNQSAWMFAMKERPGIPAWFTVDGWVYPSVSCDKVEVRDGDVIVWVYLGSKYWSSPPNPLTRGNLTDP